MAASSIHRCGWPRGGPQFSPAPYHASPISFVNLADAVLHQCIWPLKFIWSLIRAFAPGHHGYQRACDLISGQASSDRQGHQGSHAPGRPILHRRLALSQNSASRLLITSSIASWLCAVPLFVPGGRSFVPTWARRCAATMRQQLRAVRSLANGRPSSFSDPSCGKPAEVSAAEMDQKYKTEQSFMPPIYSGEPTSGSS